MIHVKSGIMMNMKQLHVASQFGSFICIFVANVLNFCTSFLISTVGRPVSKWDNRFQNGTTSFQAGQLVWKLVQTHLQMVQGFCALA